MPSGNSRWVCVVYSAELSRLRLNGKASKILRHFHFVVTVVWMSSEVPQEWAKATNKGTTQEG